MITPNVWELARSRYEKEGHCPECSCLWTDHLLIEEVDDGLALARASSGESDPSQIVTCSNCADCYEEPPREGVGAPTFEQMVAAARRPV